MKQTAASMSGSPATLAEITSSHCFTSLEGVGKTEKQVKDISYATSPPPNLQSEKVFLKIPDLMHIYKQWKLYLPFQILSHLFETQNCATLITK